MNRARIRDLGINLGDYPVGKFNAITDVPGVLVGQVTVKRDEPSVARTGITIVTARDGAIGHDHAFAGYHRFNGCGEMTGIQWVEETGMLTSAIALTNTAEVGMVRDELSRYSFAQEDTGPFYLPVVGETYDGWLSDMQVAPLTPEHVDEAVRSARSGPVDEGDVGGGTGMICHDFKGGIGTSSRLVDVKGTRYTLGALVQTNYGTRRGLRVDGVPVGREIDYNRVPSPWETPPNLSSIIVVVATDAPLLSIQCRRLAQRATTGLARVGGVGANASGDMFLAFATGQHIPAQADEPFPLGSMIPNRHLSLFFEATADAVEEAILNALCAAETVSGWQGRTAFALPLEETRKVLNKYGH